MAGYIARYSRCLNGLLYQEMLQEGDIVTFWDDTGRKNEAILFDWRKRWKHLGGGGAFGPHCYSSETDSRFLPFMKKVEYKGQLASVIVWMREKSKLLNLASWKYPAWLLTANHLWFVDSHDYWYRDCDFELGRQTTQRQAPISTAWHNLDLSGIPHGVVRQSLSRSRTGDVIRNWVSRYLFCIRQCLYIYRLYFVCCRREECRVALQHHPPEDALQPLWIAGAIDWFPRRSSRKLLVSKRQFGARRSILYWPTWFSDIYLK